MLFRAVHARDTVLSAEPGRRRLDVLVVRGDREGRARAGTRCPSAGRDLIASDFAFHVNSAANKLRNSHDHGLGRGAVGTIRTERARAGPARSRGAAKPEPGVTALPGQTSLLPARPRLVADCDDLVTYSRKCYRSSTGPRQTVDPSYRFGHGGVRGVFTSAPVGHSGVSAGSRNGTGRECLAGGNGHAALIGSRGK
jgi:hypothetical protein